MEIARGPVTKPDDSLSSSHHAGKSLINQRREKNSDVEHPRRDGSKVNLGFLFFEFFICFKIPF